MKDRKVDNNIRSLTDASLEAYSCAAKYRRFTAARIEEDLGLSSVEAHAALDDLIALRLVKQTPDMDGYFYAVRPELAAIEVARPLEAKIDRLRDRAVALQASFQTLSPMYLQERFEEYPSGLVDTLEDGAEVRRALSEAARNCEREMFGVQDQTLHEEEVTEDSLPRDFEMLKRGVYVRSLYLHAARAHRSTCAYMSKLCSAGTEIRTTTHIVDRMIVFDRKLAYLPDRRADGIPGAVVVTDPTLVSFLCRWFDRAWETGTPFIPGDVGYGESAVEVQHSILEMLGAGMKDEMIARRLGISIRTCRRHIADLMEQLDAASRFQAGVNAVRLGNLGDVGKPDMTVPEH